MSERMVIVIEYEVITGEQVESRDYMQRALTGAMTQIREGADRLDPNHVKVVAAHVGVDEFVDRVLALFAKDASAPNGAPSSPVETTDAPEQRPDPMGVIRPADEAVALTWLEIGAATREGIAKEIESAMQYEGVRAQRVMGMCAYIARTWKP